MATIIIILKMLRDESNPAAHSMSLQRSTEKT